MSNRDSTASIYIYNTNGSRCCLSVEADQTLLSGTAVKLPQRVNVKRSEASRHLTSFTVLLSVFFQGAHRDAKKRI